MGKVLYRQVPKLGLQQDLRIVRPYAPVICAILTGYQVSAFNSPEAVAMWEYLKELNKYVHPSTGIWASMSDPLLFEEVWLA